MNGRPARAAFARKPYRDRLLGVAAAVFAAVFVCARVIAMFGPLLSPPSLIAVAGAAVCVCAGAVAAGPVLSVRRLHAAMAAAAGAGCAMAGAVTMALGPLWVAYVLFKAAGWMLDLLAYA
jgi:hypothetical protein